MDDEIKALREEIAKLRERVAVLEARPKPIDVSIDWSRPVTTGTPQYAPNRLVPMEPLPPGTITC